jgi:Cdc6-like AAA superfamily ATPase
MFGLDRERRIAASGIRNIFTPHQPIHSVELFFGRQEQVQKLIEHINTPGQHALLYGDRGVGKSSLANVAAHLLLAGLVQGELYLKRCDSSTRFEDVIREPLLTVGIDLDLSEMSQVERKGGKASLKTPLFEAGVDGAKEATGKYKRWAGRIAPSDAASALSSARGLLLVDEADALATKEDKQKLAELIKLLSDAASSFKVLVVGIAETGQELTGSHPSVQRCLKETKLGRMTNTELSAIVTGGAEKAQLSFAADAVGSIVNLSAGYPHFTHLLALKCAEQAIAEGRRSITKEDLRNALSLAVQDAEGTLRRVYDAAVRSYGTDKYRQILEAAVRINANEFSAESLREAILAHSGELITQNALNNYLRKLVSDGPTTVLRRTAKGVYMFNDPRMPSYIRMAGGIVS